MAQTTVTIKKSTSAASPSNAQVVAGELAYAGGAATGGDLYIGSTDDVSVGTLISPTRQVEVNTIQTIAAAKTIDVSKLFVPDNATPAITGLVLSASATSGALKYVAQSQPEVVGYPSDITGDAQPSAWEGWNAQGIDAKSGEIIIYTWKSTDGSAYIYSGPTGTGGATSTNLIILGAATSFADQAAVSAVPATVANQAIAPTTYRGDQDTTVGAKADLTVLNNTPGTVVGAANSLQTQVSLIADNPIFISGLPAATAIPSGTYSGGAYFIISDTGDRAAYPAGGTDPDGGTYPTPLPMEAGDWLICSTAGDIDGSGQPTGSSPAAFFQLRYSFSNQTATLVSFDPTVNSPTNFAAGDLNVQLALDALDLSIFANGTLIGDNTTDIATNTLAISGIIGSAGTGSSVVEIDGGDY